MLSIKKVPTVLSLHQEDEEEEGRDNGADIQEWAKTGTVAATVASGDAEGAVLEFPPTSKEVGADLVPNGGSGQEGEKGERSLVERALLTHWEEKAERGLFKYDVTKCETRVLPGEKGYIAQLNEGRATKKRPTEFRVDLVLQEFDHSKFNFTKASWDEVLFAFHPSMHFRLGCCYHTKKRLGPSPSLVLINISPIEYGHILLVPRCMDRLPQRMRSDAFALALHLAEETDNPYFKLGYNSLGAYATINHLHFQGYFLAAPLPLELAPTEPLTSRGKVRIRQVCPPDYPVRCICFEVGSQTDELALEVAAACSALEWNNFPFNLLVTDKGCRVFVIPNAFAERVARGFVPNHIMDTGINPAAFEISGHLLCKRRDDYDLADEGFADEILWYASLDEKSFGRFLSISLGVDW